jgi:hypothetical protein
MSTKYYYALEENGRRTFAIPFGIASRGWAFTLFTFAELEITNLETWFHYTAKYKGDFVTYNGSFFEFVPDREVMRAIFVPTPFADCPSPPHRPRDAKIDPRTGLMLYENYVYRREHPRATWMLREGGRNDVIQAPSL